MKMWGLFLPPLHEDGAVGAAMEGIWSGRRRGAFVRAAGEEGSGKASVGVVRVERRGERRRGSQWMVVGLGILVGSFEGWVDGLEVKEGTDDCMGMVAMRARFEV